MSNILDLTAGRGGLVSGTNYPYKIPLPEPSPHWPGEIGAIHNSEKTFEYNLTKVTEDDVIKGLERAGFRIETNLSTSKAAKNYTHMPAIQIIATKPQI
jgi:hypothetical protein